ncbi:hypothetical protein R3P38DRAFT_2771615 [Favolaschia claudopus]|uniref:Uncharacterized protein n=1 Tax=Favolaschia claudopus TaxID=2862362 RepID=A0AAW0CCM8_9AGAR
MAAEILRTPKKRVGGGAERGKVNGKELQVSIWRTGAGNSAPEGPERERLEQRTMRGREGNGNLKAAAWRGMGPYVLAVVVVDSNGLDRSTTSDVDDRLCTHTRSLSSSHRVVSSPSTYPIDRHLPTPLLATTTFEPATAHGDMERRTARTVKVLRHYPLSFRLLTRSESSLPTYLRSSHHLFAKLRPVPQTRRKSIRNHAAPQPLNPTTSIRSRLGAATHQLLVGSFRRSIPSTTPQLRELRDEFSATPLSRQETRLLLKGKSSYTTQSKLISSIDTDLLLDTFPRVRLDGGPSVGLNTFPFQRQSVPTRSSSTHFDVTVKCETRFSARHKYPASGAEPISTQPRNYETLSD